MVYIWLAILFGGVLAIFYTKDQEEKEKKRKEEAEKERELQAKMALNGALEKNTWELPINVFCEKYIAKCGRLTEPPSKEVHYQRAKLIVEEILLESKIPSQYHERYTERHAVEKYLAALWEHIQKEIEQEKFRERQALRNKEFAFEKQCMVYAQYTGKEKTIHYYEKLVYENSQKLAECNKGLGLAVSDGARLYELTAEKESSWALHGGIAEGIAGPAAGLAVAADVARRNVAVQQRNAETAQMVGRLTYLRIEGLQKEKAKAEKSLEELIPKLDRAKMLLVEPKDEMELLKSLYIRIDRVDVTPTGAIKFGVTVAPPPTMFVYQDVPAVVDGSFQVLVQENGQTVGTAIFCLPIGGLREAIYMEGICREPGGSKNANLYQYALLPNHLWAVEKM